MVMKVLRVCLLSELILDQFLCKEGHFPVWVVLQSLQSQRHLSFLQKFQDLCIGVRVGELKRPEEFEKESDGCGQNIGRNLLANFLGDDLVMVDVQEGENVDLMVVEYLQGGLDKSVKSKSAQARLGPQQAKQLPKKAPVQLFHSWKIPTSYCCALQQQYQPLESLEKVLVELLARFGLIFQEEVFDNLEIGFSCGGDEALAERVLGDRGDEDVECGRPVVEAVRDVAQQSGGEGEVGVKFGEELGLERSLAGDCLLYRRHKDLVAQKKRQPPMQLVLNILLNIYQLRVSRASRIDDAQAKLSHNCEVGVQTQRSCPILIDLSTLHLAHELIDPPADALQKLPATMVALRSCFKQGIPMHFDELLGDDGCFMMLEIQREEVKGLACGFG